MRARVQDLVAAAAEALANKSHSVDEMHAALFQLALDIVTPSSREVPPEFRRTPVANEVLPRHQRATWARGKTIYDAEEP